MFSKSKWAFLIKMIVSLSLLTLLIWLGRKNFFSIGRLLTTVKLDQFFLAVLVFLVGLLFMAVRLKLILAAQQASFKIRDLFSLTLIGYFFSNFMPTSIGGDLVKGYYISKKGKTKLVSYASVFIDRLIGVSSLTLIAGIAMLITRRQIKHQFIFWAVGLLCLACLSFVLLLSNKGISRRLINSLGLDRLFQIFKLDERLKKGYSYINTYISKKNKFLQIFTISVLAQSIIFLAVFLLSNSLSAYISFSKIFLFMPIISVLCMLPITMNGLGLREWGFVFFLSPHIGEAAAFSVSILYLAMFLFVSLAGGIVYLFWR